MALKRQYASDVNMTSIATGIPYLPVNSFLLYLSFDIKDIAPIVNIIVIISSGYCCHILTFSLLQYPTKSKY